MSSPLPSPYQNSRLRVPAIEGLGDALRHPLSREALGIWFWIGVTGLSVLGYILLFHALAAGLAADGGLAYDARSYYRAGQAVLSGSPLYADVTIDAAVAYRYPPIFAVLWAPFSALPEPVFAWTWRLVCLASLRYICGSWRTMGVALLIPWAIVEIMSANVTFPLAAMTVAALRGRAWVLPFAVALKWSPILAFPYLWLVRPEWRRSLLMGTGAVVAIFAAHILIAPDLYRDYIAAMVQQAGTGLVPDKMLYILPSAGSDFLLRAGIAVAGTVVAIRLRSDRLAFAMTVIAQPTLWYQRLTALFGMAGLPGRAPKGGA